eukprot:m.94606 g.94606  ORF g.94606 m.94606 type:complete len:61 (-) comp26737_c1_seq1:502-684(-)
MMGCQRCEVCGFFGRLCFNKPELTAWVQNQVGYTEMTTAHPTAASMTGTTEFLPNQLLST